MSCEQSIPIEKIHSQTLVVDGRKQFGEFDRLVETGSHISETIFNPGKPKHSILVFSMEREAKLAETLTRVILSVKNLAEGTRIIVLDNSILPNAEKMVEKLATEHSNQYLESVIYKHDPRTTQSTARNTAVQGLTGNSDTVVLWDGDIYPHIESLKVLRDNWRMKPELDGIAPVMGSYLMGDINKTIDCFFDVSTNPVTRIKAHMPGEIGENIWIRDANFMRATMMRGVFWLKRNFVDQIARSNPLGEPWLKDFVVWQNVPFFIAAREIGGDFAYLLDSKAIVVHDDTCDKLSVTKSATYRDYETLKSLTILMIRNEIFTQEGYSINRRRFLNYNLPTIANILHIPIDSATKIQSNLLKIAGFFESSKNLEEFKRKYTDYRKYIIPSSVSVFDAMIKSMTSGEAFLRIKNIKSLNPKRGIYYVET